MGPGPDLSGLFWFAAVGIVCTIAATIGAGAWIAYHLFMALRLYLGS